MTRIACIAYQTFREAVRDRVLYNLVVFALLLVACSLLVGQVSIGIERQVLINFGLTAISLFGILIGIFLGIGLVSKEIDKRTLYTVLSRPVARWQFIVGKFCGLAGTLVVNTFFMATGFFAALFYVAHRWQRADAGLLIALWFIVLQLLIVTALALLFSSFSTPLESAVFAFVLFLVGSFAEDLRAIAAAAHGFHGLAAQAATWLVPNFAALNVVSRVAHDEPIAGALIGYNTLYALLYSAAAVAGAVLVFEHRNLK